MRVVVVGGGASGTLAALHLIGEASGAGRPLELHLAEPGPLGRGVAYSTGNPQHRLNVPAAGMSALPGEPAHFVHWLRAHHDPAFPAGGFAPRAVFGTYLAGTLTRQRERATGVRWIRHRTRAVDLRRHGRGAAVTLAGGQVLEADAVVLALGHGPATSGWVPAGLRRSPRFVADPWRPGGLPPVPANSAVLLVGTGLTMLDLAISYGHTRIHTVSRHGRLPLAHVADPPPPAPAPVQLPDGPVTAASLRRLIFGRIRDLDGDWRTAVDGLRPITQQAWSRLDAGDRRQVLAHAGRWERVRHRTAPELGAWLTARHQQGQLTVQAAAVTGASDGGGPVLVGLSDGTRVHADLVVNCTGRGSIVDSRDDPLVSGLLARGSARPGPLGLGFATHPDGRLVSSDHLPAWTLGQLRRGELWESTAIPEIRDQAADIAGSILARVRAGTREVA
jgi:uncharacterized NAD(P)/FAD-binding protein YdhS